MAPPLALEAKPEQGADAYEYVTIGVEQRSGASGVVAGRRVLSIASALDRHSASPSREPDTQGPKPTVARDSMPRLAGIDDPHRSLSSRRCQDIVEVIVADSR
jgi:hypothetical protein